MNAVLTHRFRRLEPKVSFSHGPAISPDSFIERHIGPREADLQEMLKVIGCTSLEELIEQTVPEAIRLRRPLQLPEPLSEPQALQRLRALAAQNQVARSYLGLGYHPCVVPPVIQRTILENPGWYTAYTPYQVEIAQGRLEALLNFQTLVSDLTGLELANASLLDEATAAAEAMSLAFAVRPRPEARTFFVAQDCHPQTIAVVQTRAAARGLQVVVGDHRSGGFGPERFGYLLQYPASDGPVYDYRAFIAQARGAGGLVVMAADLLSLTLLVPPGELGADVCVGSSQRFGLPLGFGGPHAAFFATRERFKRQVPGRVVGVSRDAAGRVGYRLALQTREQHIRRDKATSNICTAQVLPAILAAMYAVYHGPQRLRAIAQRIHAQADGLAAALAGLGLRVAEAPRFDTIRVELDDAYEAVVARARQQGINFRLYPQERSIGIALDETTTVQDLTDLIEVLRPEASLHAAALAATLEGAPDSLPESLRRRSPFLTHPVFNSYHTETELLRYIKALEAKDLSLTHSMIPLGSCTMKLSAAAELYPLSWPEFNQLHPFAPAEQWRGYAQLIRQLEAWLAELTGFAAVSLQPNAGSQGEYAGLLAIRAYHRARGEPQRTVCLIPTSAHGTNPASAALAGLEVVGVGCDAEGNVDLADLAAKAERHAGRLAALMVTYPSTHGVFEAAILEICALVHRHGGQVYLDGANLNAAVGLWRPGDIGADVCHLNLHKTFAMPHGGGGGGMGPIGVKAHLAPYLPGHPLQAAPRPGPVSAAPYGSASLLPITWMYIALMGPAGLSRATQVAIANANYLAARLAPFYPVLYRGRQGRVAHECILDLRPFKPSAGIEVEDVAKRLMDYGFHAPTVSFPVAGTLMVEPTESESKAELDRFCEAMIAIHGELRAIETGEADRQDNALKGAPHPAEDLLADAWARGYTRESAAYPLGWVRRRKFWPPVGRIDSVYGDRNLFCTCAPVDELGTGNE